MTKLLIQLTALAMVATMPVSASYATCPQPVYIIAHRCNSAGDVSDVVGTRGVNAVEGDFRYNPFSNTWWVDHDGIYSWSTPLDEWLADVEDAITPNSPLALIIFDVKTAGGDLLSLHGAARAALGEEINLIFSIAYPNEALAAYLIYPDFVEALNDDPRAGAVIDDPDGGEQYLVEQIFDSVDMANYWFGDGICAGCVTPNSVKQNVLTGIALRNSSLLACDTCFHGVYTWTYESEDSIKSLLSKLWDPIDFLAGVNGIFVNAPECYGYANPFGGGWDPQEAVAYAKSHRSINGTQFADRNHNPFVAPAPEITCPDSVTVECSVPGGVDPADPQLDALFDGADIDDRGCDAVGDAEIEAPDFFHLNQQATVTFTAADESACRPKDTCEAGVTVVDTTAPTIMNITAAPHILWPPNGKMVPVTLTVASDDVCDTTPSCRITSVTSNEARKRAKRNKNSSDWTIAGDLELRLLAERLGKGNGRIYSVGVECADASGNRTREVSRSPYLTIADQEQPRSYAEQPDISGRAA